MEKWKSCATVCLGSVFEPVCSAEPMAHGLEDDLVALLNERAFGRWGTSFVLFRHLEFARGLAILGGRRAGS